jgi:hypothetical protein
MQEAAGKFCQRPLERGLADAVSAALQQGESSTLTTVCAQLAACLPPCVNAALKCLTHAWAAADAPQAQLAAAFAELAQVIVDVGMTLEPLLVNVHVRHDTDTEILSSDGVGVWDGSPELAVSSWDLGEDAVPADPAAPVDHDADTDADSTHASDTDEGASSSSAEDEDAASVASNAATTLFHDFDTATAKWERMLADVLPPLLTGCAAVARLPRADPLDVDVLFTLQHFWLSQRTSAVLWATAASSSAMLHTCLTVVRTAGVNAYDSCAPSVPGLDVAYACVQALLLSPFWALDAPVRAQLRAELRSDLVLRALQTAVSGADSMSGLTDALRCVRAALLAWPASSAEVETVARLRRALHAAAALPHCVKGVIIATLVDLDTEVTRNVPADSL